LASRANVTERRRAPAWAPTARSATASCLTDRRSGSKPSKLDGVGARAAAWTAKTAASTLANSWSQRKQKVGRLRTTLVHRTVFFSQKWPMRSGSGGAWTQASQPCASGSATSPRLACGSFLSWSCRGGSACCVTSSRTCSGHTTRTFGCSRRRLTVRCQEGHVASHVFQGCMLVAGFCCLDSCLAAHGLGEAIGDPVGIRCVPVGGHGRCARHSCGASGNYGSNDRLRRS
jgi:hypothetical protein